MLLKLEMGIYVFCNIHWIILIPVYLCLSPFCMISSSLFDWLMSYIVDDQTITLILILLVEWAISVILILQLIRDRSGKTIFFYQFVFFLTCSNSILIGITYSLLKRDSIYQELMAKICTTLLLILIGEKMKIRYAPLKEDDNQCVICFRPIDEEYMILKCKHLFHESCLWNWAYEKQECPRCRQPIKC